MFWEEVKNFLLLNLNDYPNININFPIIIFLLSLTIALSVMFFVINRMNMYTAHLLRQILRRGAVDEDSALTLDELKVKKGFLLRSMLSKRTGKLASVVCRVGDVAMTYEQYLIASKKKGYKEEKIDFEAARFYISPDRKKIAEKILDKDMSSPIKPVLATILAVALFACAAIVIPDLLTYISNYLA